MEKKTPHYKLTRAQALIVQGAYRTTMSARVGAAALGLGLMRCWR